MQLTVAIIWSFVVILFVQYIIYRMFWNTKYNLKGKHVLITGGSKGIGYAIARACVKKGCNVTLLARSRGDLEKAAKNLESIESENGNGRVHVRYYAADTTNTEQLQKAVADAEVDSGPIHVAICNAGLSIPKLCTQTSIEEYEQQVNVNYLGTVRTVKSVLPGMLQRKSGHIILVSSVVGVLGFAGYSSYAPTKWAVRGFADCLHNELQATGVKICIAYPPDTETPGFESENQIKADLCNEVNAALGSETFSADTVASCILSQFEKGKYHLTPPDLGSTMLITTMTGLSPKVFPLAISAIMSPVLQAATAFVGHLGNRAARKYNSQHDYPQS